MPLLLVSEMISLSGTNDSGIARETRQVREATRGAFFAMQESFVVSGFSPTGQFAAGAAPWPRPDSGTLLNVS